MAQVAVTIAGKTYRIACDEGDESRLVALAEVVDRQIEGMRQRFGEIGDRRLMIMASIAIADELVDTSRRVRDLEAEVARLSAAPPTGTEMPQEGFGERVAAAIGEAAERIERVARDLDDARHE